MVHFKVLVDGRTVLEEDVKEHKLVEKDVDTSTEMGRRSKVTFVATASPVEWCIFALDGGPVN